MTSIHTIISLGPSLSLPEAQKIYPDGNYHPPFQCGDLLRLLRLNPKRIALIDGAFEHSAAIWHKEILWALSIGIEVYGASSMGALRAAEMHALGMEPVGVIAHHYIHELELDDDEVALTHDSKSESATIPMVDLRATLASLLTHNKIDTARVTCILKQAKSIPYFNRKLSTLHLEESERSLIQTHWIHQKQTDAIALIKCLSTNQPLPNQCHPTLVQSIYFRQLYHEQWHAPFPQAYAWLPTYEQDYAQRRPWEQTLITHYGKLVHLLADSLLTSQDPSLQPSLTDLLQRLSPSPNLGSIQKNLGLYYQLYFPNILIPEPWLTAIALLFDHLLEDLKQKQCELRPQTIQSFANAWRAQFGFHRVEDTQSWRHSVELDNPIDYAHLMSQLAYFDIFVQKNNGDALVSRGPLWQKSWVKEILEHMDSIKN